MAHHHKLSESSDDSIDHPPSLNCNGNQPEEIIQRKRKALKRFQRKIEKLKSESDINYLISQIKKLNDITDEVESVHKNTTVGSLVGSSVGAVGGITALVGLALSPFTLGASLSLTTVGAVVGAAGGATGAVSNFTNMFKQKNLRQTIMDIINDFLEKIKPMLKHLNKISSITVDIQQLNKKLSKLEFRTQAKGFDDLLKIAKVADVAVIGKICAEAAKEIRVYVKAVNAMRGPAQAARAIRATAENAKYIRMTAAATGVLSALFLALDVASIVQDSTEIAEMNQGANKKNAEEIKSETLKFIHYMRETTSQFQDTLDKIKQVIDTFN